MTGSKDSAVDSALTTQTADDMSRSFALTTKLDALVAWGQRNSLWPLPYGTACCGIELMSVMGPKYDLARFGAEVVRFSPRQADLLLVAGTITEKMAPILVRIYQQMLEPKYVISMGACASSGGFYRAYHVLQGCDKVVPVDVYVPGCPPTPEAVLDGVMTLQKMIKDRSPRPWKDNWKYPFMERANANDPVQLVEKTPLVKGTAKAGISL
ncbi:MAG: NADH-quinone oxidoreductase subunit B family protein [Pseudobdellovibrio sp.]